ncbi:MAG: flagellar filament capping protein FliD [Pseudomonadota bacterium]
MASSTQVVSGLASGLDWRGIVDQLRAVEYQRVELVADQKTKYENQLSEWQSVNTMLLTLKSAAEALSTEEDFNVFSASTTSDSSVSASSIFTVTTSSTASAGLYTISVNDLAKSQKISSNRYTATDTAVGVAGDILVSGKAINLVATDTLANIKDKINAANTGDSPSEVTATIVKHSSTDYHLVLTADETGEDGLSVLEGSSATTLQSLGFISGSTTIKTTTSDGMKSDLFSNSNSAVGTLLGLSGAESGTVTIGGTGVAIDLENDSITTIAAAIDAIGGVGAGISASVVSEEVDGETRYRIDISGTTSYTDSNNILQTLGFVQGAHTEVAEVQQGSVSNTTDGAAKITATTQWNQIFGANVQAGTSFTISGNKHDGTAVSGSFTISGVAAQVQELLTYIQGTVFSSGVTMAISNGKIQITDNSTGDSQLELTVATNNPAGGLLDFGAISVTTEGRDMELTAGQDAEFELDGVTLTSSSNTVTEVIQGATLNLVGAPSTATEVTLEIERDLGSIKSKINELVDAYNEIMGYINSQFTYDEENEETGGVLFGDGTLSSVKSEIIDVLLGAVDEVSADYNRLSLIGISLDDDALLTVDDEDLTDLLESNFDDVRKLFMAYGHCEDSALLQYTGHTTDTQGGAYNVKVTTPSTRTTVTGASALAGTLGEDFTLSITDYATGREADVSLTDDMDLEDVINAVNSELAEEKTEVLAGSVATGKTISTKFSDITDADNGDAITFFGKKRNGILVSGSYTIGDKTTEDLGDLLETIEDLFEEEVTASLDGTGKLIITDKQAGDSQLELSVDTSAMSAGLNFGTVNTSNTGGVSGRYAMTITASEGTGAAADKLVLTHNTYGTGKIIVVSDNSVADPLGIDSAAQVYGVDVAGTINGLTATGSGQALALDADDDDADGLSVTYTGTTATGVDGLDLTLTLGVAELLDRQLGFITDVSDGYVTYKQDSLETRIDDLGVQIEDMEASLDLKMERMINQFVAMELQLGKLQNISSWLGAQITGMFG